MEGHEPEKRKKVLAWLKYHWRPPLDAIELRSFGRWWRENKPTGTVEAIGGDYRRRLVRLRQAGKVRQVER